MDEKHGGKWKLLQSLAVVHLGQPYTNAAVERLFSRSTWVDAARAQQVLDCTFEMRVLDAYNRDLVEMAKPLLDEKKAFQESSMAVEEVVNRFAIPSEDNGKEEDKDSETATAVFDDDDEISVIAVARTQGDADESESESESESEVMTAQNKDSIICQLEKDEVNALLQSKNKATTGKKKAPPKAPPSSTKKKKPSSKKATRK
jgi:hypothetical protein